MGEIFSTVGCLIIIIVGYLAVTAIFAAPTILGF